MTFLVSLASGQIKLKELNNPILPFSLGNAQVTTHKHSFIKYLNLDEFINPIKSLEINSEAIIPLINKKDESYPQLHDVHSHLKYLLKQTRTKFENIRPLSNTRQKRGLLNVVGKASKWAFGTLDSEDAERYDNAIATLETNQKDIHTDLNNYLTITKQFMNDTVITLENIISNQNDIYHRVKIVEQNLNKFTLFIKIQNFLDVMIIDCMSLINILDNIQNAILFAQLESVHNSLLPINELQDLIDQIKTLYPHGLYNFKSIQSYYELIKAEIYYNNQLICFIFHFPILRESTYNYYHLYPIPIHNQTIIPLKPYIIINSTYHHYEDAACLKIEELCIYHIEQQISNQDCLPAALTGTTPLSCATLTVNLERDIVEQINNAYLVVIPVKNMTIEKMCNEHGFITVQQPHLIYLPNKCSVTIHGNTYKNSVGFIHETPLEILPIRMINPDLDSVEATPLQHINIDKLSSLQQVAERTHLHRLKTFKTSSSETRLISYTCLTIIAFLLTFFIFKILNFNKQKIYACFACKNKTNKLLEEKPEVPLDDLSKDKEKTSSLVFSS